MNRRKYDDLSRDEAQAKILRGEDPDLDAEIITSKNPIHIALKTAMNMCLEVDPRNRASAEEVYMYLSTELSKQGENKL